MNEILERPTSAAVRLLLDRYLESPRADPGLVTVVIHQLLSLIVERGGARAGDAMV